LSNNKSESYISRTSDFNIAPGVKDRTKNTKNAPTGKTQKSDVEKLGNGIELSRERLSV